MLHPGIAIGGLYWKSVTVASGTKADELDYRPILPDRPSVGRYLVVVAQGGTDGTAASLIGLGRHAWTLPGQFSAFMRSSVLCEVWQPIPAYWDGVLSLITVGAPCTWSVAIAPWLNPPTSGDALLGFAPDGSLRRLR